MNPEVICREVVITRLLRRGTGKEDNPIRAITQVYEKDGTLIAESDPQIQKITVVDVSEFAKWCIRGGYSPEEINTDLAISYLIENQHK